MYPPTYLNASAAEIPFAFFPMTTPNSTSCCRFSHPGRYAFRRHHQTWRLHDRLSFCYVAIRSLLEKQRLLGNGIPELNCMVLKASSSPSYQISSSQRNKSSPYNFVPHRRSSFRDAETRPRRKNSPSLKKVVSSLGKDAGDGF